MLTLETVNNHLSAFGRLVRIQRLYKRLALRDLAQKANLSHTLLNKIEHAKNLITESTFSKLEHALGMYFEEDEEKNRLFDREQVRIYDGIYYAQSQKVLSHFKRVQVHEAYYLNSLYAFDYVLLKIGTHAHVHNLEVNEIAVDISVISNVVTLCAENMQSIFYLYRGMYHFSLSDTMETIKDMLLALDAQPEEKYIPLIQYFLGCAYSYEYQINLANDYYKESLLGFEKYTNFRRTLYLQLFIAINDMKLYDYTGVKEAFENVLYFAKREGITWLTHVSQIHLVLMYMLRKDYDSALKMGEDIDYKSMRYYAFMAYCALRLKKKRLFNKFVKQSSGAVPEADKFNVYEKALTMLILESKKEIVDAHIYEKSIKDFYDASLSARAFFELELAYDIYGAYLADQRRYKEAYELTNTMINIVQKTMQ